MQCWLTQTSMGLAHLQSGHHPNPFAVALGPCLELLGPALWNYCAASSVLRRTPLPHLSWALFRSPANVRSRCWNAMLAHTDFKGSHSCPLLLGSLNPVDPKLPEGAIIAANHRTSSADQNLRSPRCPPSWAYRKHKLPHCRPCCGSIAHHCHHLISAHANVSFSTTPAHQLQLHPTRPLRNTKYRHCSSALPCSSCW
jgi:hypothetical protein